MDEQRRALLRERRRQAAIAREHAQSRASYGVKLVEAVVKTIGQSLSLDDFDASRPEPLPIVWGPDAPGLRVEYISEDEARALLASIRGRLGSLHGDLGFQCKPYLGIAGVSELDPLRLLALADATEESVTLYSSAPLGVLMVDCYRSPPGWPPFSVVVQGDDLVRRLADCFPPRTPE